MKLWVRVAALLVVLAVPLALALASQGLAARPGAPAVPAEPIRLAGPPVPAAATSTARTPAPGAPSTPRSSAATPGAATDGPRVVAPDVQRDDDLDDAQDPDDDTAGDDDD